MVAEGSSSPDPSERPSENLLPADVGMILASSSDSEEEEVPYGGYEALPQEILETNNVEGDDSDSDTDSEEGSSDEANETDLGASQLREPPSFDQSMNSELSELWNSSSSSRQTDIVMDSTKEEQIKNAMAHFRLPSSAIPPWAAEIPEEEWKEQLKNRVALLNKVMAV